MGDPPRGADDPSRDATPPASDGSADGARRPHDATLRFEYDSAARARAVARSVAQEVGEIDGDRSVAAVDREGSTVAVRVLADDLVALRAGCNTWGSLVEVAERTTDLA